MSIDAIFTRGRKRIEPGHGSLCKLCRHFRRGRQCAVAAEDPELVQSGIPKVASAIFCTHIRRSVNQERDIYGPREIPLP